MSLEGGCCCGAVSYTVEGEPVAQLYCHCRSCQSAHSAPLAAVAIFPVNTVNLQGETRSLSVTERPLAAVRICCTRCGTRVANIPGGEGGGQWRAIFPQLCRTRDWFSPSMHIFWEERSIEVDDTLPKYLDVPADFGGSGRTA